MRKYLAMLIIILCSINLLAQEDPEAELEIDDAEPPKVIVIPKAKPEPRRIRKQTQPERGLKGGVTLYNSFANSIVFDSVSATSGAASANGSINFSTDAAMGIGFEATDMAPNSWGVGFGLNYDFERKLNAFNLTMNGVTSTGTYIEPKSTLSVYSLNANAIHQWEKFFLTFGLNYCSPNLKTTGTSSITATGGVGGQIGVGILVSENFAIELQQRQLTMNWQATSGAMIINYGNGLLSGPQLKLRFIF